MTIERKKIVRLLGVGFDADDKHVRLTKGDQYDVVMGSEESHAYLQEFIQKIEDKIKADGKTVEDFTPEELTAFIQSMLDQ